jgi:YVTN family beta-propeller protein
VLHVALFDSSQLVTLNSDTLATLSTLALAPLGSSQPNAVAVDQATGRVYVTSRANANVAVISGRSGAWLTRVNTGNLPWGVAADAGRAYVANFADNTVTIINTANNTLVGAATVAGQPALVASGAGKAFVTSAGAGKVSFVAGPGDVAQIAIGSDALGVAYMNGRVYVGSRSARRLTVVDAQTGAVIAGYDMPGPIYALAANPSSGRIFAVDAENDRLYVVNADNGAIVANLPVGRQDKDDGGQGLAVDPLLGRVFVANYAAGTLTVVSDCAPAGQPTPTPSATPAWAVAHRFHLPVIVHEDGAPPYESDAPAPLAPASAPTLTHLPALGRALAVDNTTGLVYVAEGAAVRVFERGQSSAKLSFSLRQADAPGMLLAHAGTLVVSLPYDNAVAVVDAHGRVAARVEQLARPWGMALAADGATLYVAEAGGSTVAVVDVATWQVVRRIKTGDAPYLLALAGDGRTLFAATPGDRSVWVIPLSAEAGAQRLTVPGLGLTVGMVALHDDGAAIVYAVSPRLRAIARLTRAAGDDNYAIKTIREGDYSLPLTEAAGIAADGARLYVADADYLWALDAESGDVAGATYIAATADTFGLAVDVQTGRVLIADARGGPVVIIAGRQ